jgi:HEPN domain-containing protein
MKNKDDLVRSWIRKAESDLDALELILAANKALDAACFHAQQAAEKYLKAYLIYFDIDFPYVHDIEKLIHLCASHNTEFSDLADSAGMLTPYAVELRYDDDFWPAGEDVTDARQAALAVKTMVLNKLPEKFR